jgi:hypothetical protein
VRAEHALYEVEQRYRLIVVIPHLAEQVGMAAGAGTGEHQFIFVDRIHEQPVVLYVAFPKALEVAVECMVVTLRREGLFLKECSDDVF